MPNILFDILQIAVFVFTISQVIEFFFRSHNRFSDAEIDEMLHGAPVDSKGNFNYVKFTRIIKHGKDDD